MNTIDVYLCIEDDSANDDECKESLDPFKTDVDDVSDAPLNSIQRHNKYMFSSKQTKQFYFAPFKSNKQLNKNETNWNVFEFNQIFPSETSFLCDIFGNVINPLIQSFKNGQSGCLALYSPDS